MRGGGPSRPSAPLWWERPSSDPRLADRSDDAAMTLSELVSHSTSFAACISGAGEELAQLTTRLQNLEKELSQETNAAIDDMDRVARQAA